MKHTRRWLALILAIALVAANASYQLGTSLYAKEDQAAVETQSEENQKQEAVNTEEPKSTGSAQVEEVQEDQNTSDDATQAEESKNTQAAAKASSSADNNAEQNQADIAQANENAVAAATASDVAPTLAANTDGSVSGSGYDSITLVVNTDGITNQNNTKFNIKFDTGNTENNKKISASNLNPSEGLASNLMKNRGGTYDVNGFNKNAFTITVTKGADCKNSIKTEATVDVASGTVTLNISDYYESSYNDKTFTNPTATSLGSVNDFAVFANNYKNHVDMEGNIAVKNLKLANTNSGNSDEVQARDFNLNYVENFELNSMKSEFFRKADPLIIGDLYEINTQDSNFNLKLANGSVINLGPSNKMKDVVNIKNSSYKINFDEAMAGLRQYASTMYQKKDTDSVRFKSSDQVDSENPEKYVIGKTGSVKVIECVENVNNIINIKASDLKKWADNVQITGLGDTGSVTFNIKYDVAQEFTKPHFTINGTGTGGYDVTGGRILLNFGTQQGEITFGELYSGTILAPNATVDIYATHNGSVFADTVENIKGEIHKNPWKPGNEQKPASVKVTLKGTKTLNGTSAQKDAFSFLLQQTDENGTVLENGHQQNVKNGENGQISFDEITYTTPGTYYYKISEVSGSDVNIRYDASVYKVVVTVDENMTATVAYYKDGNLVNSDTGAAFSNTSIVREVKASLQGNKTLNGQPSTASYKYQVVEVADEKGTVKDNAQSWEVTNNTTETAAIEFPEFTYNAAGDYYYKVTEVNANADGMEYDPSVYIAHVSVAAQNDGSLTASVTYRKYASADQMNSESAANADKITFANKTLKAQVTFTGNKTVNGSEAKDKFSFKVVEKDKDGNVVNTISDNITNKTGEGENGAIQFPAISYTKAGIHYYDVREINDSADTTGIAYDNTVYTVVVVVGDDNSESGTGLTTNAVYYKDFDYKTKTGVSVENNSITFANNMSASVSLEGMKTLDGKKVSKAGEYSFDIVETNASGDALEGEAPQSVSNDNTGKFTFPAYTYTDEGTHYYKITENQNNPKSGIKYDTSSYLVTVTVAKTVEDGKVSLKATVTDTKKTDANNTVSDTKDITFNNQTITYSDAKIQLTATKNLAGSPSEKEFDFKMEECDENGNVTAGTKVVTASNDKSGLITFDELTYKDAGTHYYKISEAAPENPEANIVYDNAAYIVKVDVTKDDTAAALTATASEYKKLVIGADGQTTTENVESVVFNNGIKVSTSFTGQKYVDGELASTAGAFSFTLTRTDDTYANALTGEDAYSETVSNDAAGNITFTEINYDTPGDYYYTISENVPEQQEANMYYDEAVYRAKVTVSKDGQITVEKSVVPYVGYEGDDGNTFEPVEDDEFLIFNNYHFMTMSMDYALATITGTKTLKGGNLEAGEFRFGLYDSNGTLIDTKTNDASGKITFRTIPYYTAGTYSYTVKEINEQGENNVSDIEYDPSVYTVTVNVDENMDTSITYIKNGTNVDNSSESVDGISFENKMSVTAVAIDPAVKKVLNNAELQPGEFTFQLFDENNNLIDTKKNTDNGSVLFDSIIFDEVGDYNYTIKELIPSDPGQITYDDREIKVNVSVTKDDTTGNLEAAITYLEDNAPTEEPTFVNTYNPISIRVQKTSKDGSKDPLKGATYALYKVLSGEGRDILIGTQISDENGYMTFENVEPGSYYFKEVSAPAGHTVDEYATKKFTVSADGTINQLTAKRSSRSTQAVMFSLDSLTAEDAQISALEADDNKDAIVLVEAPGVSDEVTKLSVSKLDYTNHEFVTGAKMQILEKSSGKIVAEWTTGDSAESFERKLNVDTSYILREVSAPEGYDLAEDTEFIIDAYGILSIISGPDAEKTSDTALRIYDKKLGVTKVTKNTKENHNQKFVDVVKTVKTGDTAQIGLFAILSIAAIVVVIIVLRRRKNS